MSGLVGQAGWVARRSIKRALRQPAVIVPTIVFPIILLAINSKGLQAATRLPGFPTDNYLNFAIVVTFVQAGLFATTSAGTELAHDIETGFLDRLSLTPLRRTALLLGQLTGAVTVGMIGAVVYLVVGLAAGATVEAGVLGVVVLYALVALICTTFASIGSLMALKTGSAEAVQGAFPLLFVLFFLSSLNLPRNLIEAGWFRTIATWNPISYMVEWLRSLVITGWDGTALWKCVAVCVALLTLALLGASRMLRQRVART